MLIIRFAHGRQELRYTGLVYKTRLCHFFLIGDCNKGKAITESVCNGRFQMFHL